MSKLYRCLVGSFQDSERNEYSRGDRVVLTDEEAGAAGDAVEPWDPPVVPAPEPVADAPVESEPEPVADAKSSKKK